MVEEPRHRIRRLVPFVHVRDIEQSLGFYQQLGFAVTGEHRYRDQLAWVALESEGAELMLERTNEPLDPAAQGVLFYLYCDDLTALRNQLLADDIDVSDIEDGSPGPEREMRVVDPDGYLLMVAENERQPID